jgi:hypothetical protein
LPSVFEKDKDVNMREGLKPGSNIATTLQEFFTPSVPTVVFEIFQKPSLSATGVR